MIEVEARVTVTSRGRVEEWWTEVRFIRSSHVWQVRPSSVKGFGSVLCFASGEELTVRREPEEIVSLINEPAT